MDHLPASNSPGKRVGQLCVAVLLAFAWPAAPARAAVEWHVDLETAHAAARISRRPVLAVFVAAWDEGKKPFEATCLGSPEAEAVLATCFEPVRVDIERHSEVTRAAGISHVPTACVLAADGTVLASFEMPGSPAEFVTAAILAARRAADLETPGRISPAVAREPAAGEPPAPAPATTAVADPFAATNPPQRGPMARVTAKVRELSVFATTSSRPAIDAAPATIAHASRAVTDPDDERVRTPVSWPAEPAAAPPAVAAIEPATSTVAPWIDAQPAPQVPRDVAAAPAAAPLPAPAQPEPPAKPAQLGLIATLQKPFAIFGKPAAAQPPTMPPALPRGPLADALSAAAPPPSVAADPAASAGGEDVHGSMPLGLEGYCPVTLVDRGSWVEGRAQWGARHRGRTYLFAGPEQQQTFLADPDRYAPALSGDDPVLALDRASSTPGQRRYGITYQSRVYLFATPETRTAFGADPGRYAARVALAERSPAAASDTRTY